MDKNIVFRTCFGLYSGTLKLFKDGQIGYSYGDVRRPYKYRENIPCIMASNLSAYKFICEATFFNNAQFGDTIYVEPKARIRRDILRNSGYKITRDKEKANCVVIEEPEDDKFLNFKANLAVWDDEYKHLYFFRLSKEDYYIKGDPTDDDIERIKRRLDEAFGHGTNLQYFYNEKLGLFNYSLVPDVESYLDILEFINSDEENNFVLDSEIKINPNVEISPETLDIWRRLDERDMLEKCIIGSDWQKYPFTLYTFLSAENDYVLRHPSNRNMEMICKKLEESANQLVSAEDWNMLQKWILYQLGIYDAENGWISLSKLENLDYSYRQFIRKRIAVSSIMASEPVDINNTKEIIIKC